MAQESGPQKSLLEQIVDETLAHLETRAEFDKDTVGMVKQIASIEGLANAQQIIDALKGPPPEEQDEAD